MTSVSLCSRPVAPDKSQRMIFFIHGGGFVFGSMRTHMLFVRGLVSDSCQPVFGPNYRNPPLVSVATCVDECVAA